jgi:hypothetical protein
MTEHGLATKPEPPPEPEPPPQPAWHSRVTAVLRDATGERILMERAEPVPWTTGSREPADPSDPERATLPHIRIEDYQWVAESEAVVPDEALERAWALAGPLTMLYQACSYRHLLAGLEPMARPGLDGGLSGWLELLAKAMDAESAG